MTANSRQIVEIDLETREANEINWPTPKVEGDASVPTIEHLGGQLWRRNWSGGPSKPSDYAKLEAGRLVPLEISVPRDATILAVDPTGQTAILQEHSTLREAPLDAIKANDSPLHLGAITGIQSSADAALVVSTDRSGRVCGWRRADASLAAGARMPRDANWSQLLADTPYLALASSSWNDAEQPWGGGPARPGEQIRLLDTGTGEVAEPWRTLLSDDTERWCHGTFGGVLQLLRFLPPRDGRPETVELSLVDLAGKLPIARFDTGLIELHRVAQRSAGDFALVAGTQLDDAGGQQRVLEAFDLRTGQRVWSRDLALGEDLRQASRTGRYALLTSDPQADPARKEASPKSSTWRLIELASGETAHTWESPCSQLLPGQPFDANDRRLVVPSRRDGTQTGAIACEVIDLEQHRVLSTFRGGEEGTYLAAALSSDGATLALWNVVGATTSQATHRATIHEVSSQAELWRDEQTQGASPRHPSPRFDRLFGDQELLVQSTYQPAVRYDLQQHRELPPLNIATPITQVISVGNEWIVTGDLDGRVAFWDRATGEQVAAELGHRGPVSLLTLLRDGKTIASGGHDTTVVLWPLPAAPGNEIRK